MGFFVPLGAGCLPTKAVDPAAWVDGALADGNTRAHVLVDFAESPENIIKTMDWLIEIG
jgi:hypothetical protein